ncbi:MAG: Xaa-Pro peptidase family protein [Pseudomonadota bacterium]
MLDSEQSKRLRAYRVSRVREQLAQSDTAGIVLFDPVNIRYATGSSNMQVWTLHNPSRYAFVAADGPVILFDFHGARHLVEGIESIDEFRNATSWFYFNNGPRVAKMAKRWATEIADVMDACGGGNKRLAADRIDPAGVAELERLGVSVHEGQNLMEQARVIKSSVEIDAIRESIRVCQLAMDAMRNELRPGITENQLWSHLHQVNIANGGEWIETRLLSSGPRTNPWFSECSDRVIEAGDLVSFDTDMIGPGGYCADISRSWVCGESRPSDEQRRLYAYAFETIERYIERLKPGLTFREFSDAGGPLPESMSANRYPCMLHGIGLCDEYPFIAYPEDFDDSGFDGVLEEGMTVCVEAYGGEVGGREGVKLEEQMLITADGAQRLSSYEYEAEFL